MKKKALYTITALIVAIAVTSLFALTAVAAERAAVKSPAKSNVMTEKPDFSAVRLKLQAKSRSETARGNTDLQTKRSNLERDQKAQIESRNSQAKSEFTRLKTSGEQFAKIRAEAIQMNSKYASSSPAEKAKMDKRAGELMAELTRLGH